MLGVVLELSRNIIRLDSNYNHCVEHNVPNRNKHSLFNDCIGTINNTHVRTILPQDQRVNFIGRKGISTWNVLAACDFNLYLTFVLAGTTRNTHDARILAWAIHSPDIHFSQLAPRKYYLIDLGFVYRPGTWLHIRVLIYYTIFNNFMIGDM